MKARLGFAINVFIRPDILIVDEAMSVGDANFQKKCREKMRAMINDYGTTLLLVTHSTATAKQFCDRGIVMRAGRMIYDGEISEAIGKYNESLKQIVAAPVARVTSEKQNRIARKKAKQLVNDNK